MTIRSIIFFGLLTIIAACGPNKPYRAVVFDLPDTLQAGQKIAIPAISAGKLIVQNSVELFVFEANTTDSLRLDHAGKYVFQHLLDDTILVEKKLTVLPQKATSTVLLVGGKSMVANGKSVAMAVLIAEDAFHNPVTNMAHFYALRPRQNVEESSEKPHHLVVYKNITSQTLAGKTLISVEIDGLKTTAKEVTEVAGEATNFRIEATKIIPFADNNQYFDLTTALLKDAWGNVVEDGTIVELWLTDSRQTRTHFEAYTINGIASWSVKNPDEVGIIELQAQSNSGLSNKLKVKFLSKNNIKVSLEKL